MSYRIWSLVGLVGLSMVVSSCKESETNTMSGSSPSNDGGNGTVDDSGGFYVKVVSKTNVATSTHAFEGFNTECKIAPTASGKDLSCMVHIREHDLYFYGLTFEINVPKAMCQYLWEMPYYYYNHEPGTGPKSISVLNDGDAGSMLSCTIDGVAGTVSGNICSFPSSEGSITSSGAASCVYDHTSVEGPNCCDGSYATAITTRKSDGNGGYEFATVNASGKWGGGHGKCVSGPTTKNDWVMSKSGYPTIKVNDVKAAGLNKQYVVAAPINAFNQLNNYFAANFFDWSAYKAGTYATAARPEAIVPGLDRSGGSDAIAPGRDSYEYRCYNESGELKNRIRMYVVEWDSNEALSTYISSAGVSGSPEATGVDGTNCSTEGAIGDSTCDDFADWSGLMTGFPQEAAQ